MKRLMLATTGLLLTMSVAVAQEAPSAQADGALTVVHVSGNVYMAAGAGPNVTFQVGDYGPVIVDTPPAAQVPQLLAEINKINSQRIFFLFHTTGEPEYMSGDVAVLSDARVEDMIVHEKILDRLAGTDEEKLLPITTIGQSAPEQTTYNSEPIVIYQVPAAITNADSIIFFRKSDVISVGGLYSPDRYPAIDVAQGGSIEGLIDAMYKILALAVPDMLGDDGTTIIPGHGRLAQQTDVAEYRNMLVIVRDRVQDMKNKGMSLQQVQGQRPTIDFDTWMNASRSDADKFVEAVYRTLPRNAQHGGQHS